MLGTTELLILLGIVLVIFGTKRLISAGGDLGKAIQSFKKGMRDASDDPAKLEPPASPGTPGGSGAADGQGQGQAPGAGDRPHQDR